MNAKELIKMLGGPSAVASELDVLQSAVSNWSKRGVPWSKRHFLADLARKKRIKLPDNFRSEPFWGAQP
jgi:hypothetical protein